MTAISTKWIKKKKSWNPPSAFLLRLSSWIREVNGTLYVRQNTGASLSVKPSWKATLRHISSCQWYLIVSRIVIINPHLPGCRVVVRIADWPHCHDIMVPLYWSFLMVKILYIVTVLERLYKYVVWRVNTLTIHHLLSFLFIQCIRYCFWRWLEEFLLVCALRWHNHPQFLLGC